MAEIGPVVTEKINELPVKVDELMSMELDPWRALDPWIKTTIESALELIVAKSFEEILTYYEESLDQLVFPNVSKVVVLRKVWHLRQRVSSIGIGLVELEILSKWEQPGKFYNYLEF